MASLNEIANALADAVIGIASSSADELMDLQCAPIMLVNPTPPAVDIFPADPSQDYAAFVDPDSAQASRQVFWTVRARVSTADDESAQKILLLLMEPAGETSIKATIENDSDVADVVDAVMVNGPSGYRLYQNPAPAADLEHQGALIGVEWQVVTLAKTGAMS